MMASIIIAVFLCSQKALAAGAIEEIINSMVGSLFESISDLLLSLCDFVIGPIFSITTMTVSQISAYIPGFSTGGGSGAYFSSAIKIISLCIASMLTMASVIRIMYGLAAGNKVESPGKLVGRIFITFPLVIAGQRLLSLLFDNIVSPIAQAFAGGATAFQNSSVFKDMAAPLTSDSGTLTTLLVGTILMVMIASSLIQLILEAAERYLMCIFLIFLSPIGFSFAVNEESSQVAKNWFKMFFSHCILLILNIWVIGIARTCFDTIDATATPQQILVWGIITYGYIKIAQKLDDILQNSGLLITRTGGDFLHDMVAAGATIGKALSLGTDTAALVGGAAYTKVTGGDANKFLSEQIPRYASKHPVAGAAVGAGVAVGAGAVAGAKGLSNMADTKAAGKVLDETNDARKKMQSGASNANFNTAAFHKAAENRLRENGFADNAVANGAKVESLQMNNDGSMTGSLVKRDANGKVLSATAFTMSNTGAPGGKPTTTMGASLTMSQDGKSATLTTPDKGSFSLQQKGVDGKGNPVWEATQLTNAAGEKMENLAPGMKMSEEFSFRPDAKNPDGDIAQAAAFMQASGNIDNLVQAYAKTADEFAQAKQALGMSNEERLKANAEGSLNLNSQSAIQAAEQQLKASGAAADVLAAGGKVEGVSMNGDGSLSASVAQRDAEGNLTGSKTYRMDGADTAPIETRSMKMSADGKTATISDSEKGQFTVTAAGMDARGNQLFTATRTADAAGGAMAPGDAASETFSFRPDARNSTESATAQAAAYFTNGAGAEALVQKSNAANQDYAAAGSAFNMSNEQRVAAQASGSGLNYNSDGFHMVASEKLRGFEPAAAALDNGGKVESVRMNEDGSISATVMQRDAEGHALGASTYRMGDANAAPTASQSIQFSPDGKSAVIDDAEHGKYELHQVGTDKYNNQVWEATRVSDAGGKSVSDQIAPEASASQTFTFRGDNRSGESMAEQATARFVADGGVDALAQTTNESAQAYTQLRNETQAAHAMFDMTDSQRVEQLRGDSGVVNYSDEAHLRAMTERLRSGKEADVDDSIVQMVQNGGKVAMLSATDDGRLVGLIERRDDNNQVVEESFFSLSSNAVSAGPDTPVSGKEAGPSVQGGAEPASVTGDASIPSVGPQRVVAESDSGVPSGHEASFEPAVPQSGASAPMVHHDEPQGTPFAQEAAPAVNERGMSHEPVVTGTSEAPAASVEVPQGSGAAAVQSEEVRGGAAIHEPASVFSEHGAVLNTGSASPSHADSAAPHSIEATPAAPSFEGVGGAGSRETMAQTEYTGGSVNSAGAGAAPEAVVPTQPAVEWGTVPVQTGPGGERVYDYSPPVSERGGYDSSPFTSGRGGYDSSPFVTEPSEVESAPKAADDVPMSGVHGQDGAAAPVVKVGSGYGGEAHFDAPAPTVSAESTAAPVVPTVSEAPVAAPVVAVAADAPAAAPVVSVAAEAPAAAPVVSVATETPSASAADDVRVENPAPVVSEAPAAAAAPAEVASPTYTESRQASVEQAAPTSTVVSSCEEVHHVKYEPHDASSGILETSDLGRLQLTRTKVNERTGDSTWQIVQKRSADDEHPDSAYITEITRKGNRGAAEDFMDFAREMSRKAHAFDQVGVLDSRNSFQNPPKNRNNGKDKR